MENESPGALARVRRYVFARHCNPWSAWTRWASTPMIPWAVWTRDRRHAAVTALWMAVNPVVFPEPADDGDWATRAMLGEEQWIVDRPRDAAMAVQAVTSLAMCAAVVSAYRRRALPTVLSTAAAMGLTMVYWEQMARYHDRKKAQETDGREV